MKRGERIYRALRKQGLTDKEIAESHVLPVNITKKEKSQADKDFSVLVQKRKEQQKGTYLITCNRCEKGKRVKDLRLIGTECGSCNNGVYLSIDGFIPSNLIKK